MWQRPWGYKEGIAVGAGLFMIGFLLQQTVGAIRWELMAYPVNVFMAIGLCGSIVVMHLLRRRVYAFRWLSTGSAVVPALLWTTTLTVIMGLVRQGTPHPHAHDFLGFSQMISTWHFVLIYLWMTIALGLTLVRGIFPLSLRRVPFLLNHLGLFIALVSATLGSADMQRLTMTTKLGRPEWRAMDERGQLTELPVAIELKSFDIEEYPPKLMMIENESGKTLPADQPAHILLEDSLQKGTLLGWDVEVTETIPMAATFFTEDSLKYTPFHSMGATYAVHLKARHPKTHQQATGWVSGGSFAFPYKSLKLDSTYSIVMPEREPKRFASEVVVYTESGTVKEGIIEVNQPLELEGWKIYQVSYDEEKGKWSDISVFELIRDPWLPVVYTGIVMMMLGAMGMFISAQTTRRKEDRDDLG